MMAKMPYQCSEVGNYLLTVISSISSSIKLLGVSIICEMGKIRGCLVYVFKQQFSVFKQYFTYFNVFFHLHVFSQMFLNNNFQFLNTHTKRVLKCVVRENNVFYVFERSL